MKCPEYPDVGECILKPYINDGMVKVVVNIDTGEEQTVALLNSKELKYLAKYIDSLNPNNKSQIIERTFCGDMYFNEKIQRTSICNKYHRCEDCSTNLNRESSE